MKLLKKGICLMLLSALLLSGCGRTPVSVEPDQTPTVAPETPPPATPGVPSQTPGTPVSQPPTQSPAETDAQAEPFDKAQAMPLLVALAECIILDKAADFERYPDAAIVDMLFYRLLRDGKYPGTIAGITVNEEENKAVLTGQGLAQLYASCFSEGQFSSLPVGGYGVGGKDTSSFALGGNTELQCTVELKEYKALIDGYWELKYTLYWAYPEDSQAIEAGSMLLWATVDPDASFGIKIAKLQSNISLRPGDVIGTHPKRDMEYIKPLLHSIAKASHLSRDGFSSPAGPSFAWLAAYTMVNSYGADFGLDISGKSVFVSKDVMQDVFHALFGEGFSIPSIPSKISGRVSSSDGGYSVKLTKEDTDLVFASYTVGMDMTDEFTVSLKVGDKTVESPLSFIGTVRVALKYEEGQKYKDRYALGAVYTPGNR